MEIATQIIGIVAMLFNILSYQGKTNKQILTMQFIGGTLFSVNYFMLGAFTGALLNLFSMTRALYLFKAKQPRTLILVLLCFLVVVLYAMSFLVFGTPMTTKNFIVELLPTVAQIVMTVAFFKNNAKIVRYCGFVSSPLWLAYNIICFTIGGILCECFALISIIVGIIRYRKNPTKRRYYVMPGRPDVIVECKEVTVKRSARA